MGLHQLPRQMKPDPESTLGSGRSGLSRLSEKFENRIELIGRDTNASVRDLNHCLRGFDIGAHGNCSVCIGLFRGVVKEILQHLYQAHVIAKNADRCSDGLELNPT
jgi:hypothetical protein